ncbi:ADP-polyphosphate phosphotransferase [Paraburkholderia adhaesiva]|uniref:ADP-polyphosphate phosphotransferase n=1 Tax=Paraburkholderia adhaesiva TaxID=2883244 RepID=UPI001F439B4E|nr:ADP-polyphosphate phosphotransferase [Paraburkholderia adhaesiva]
MKIHSDDFRAPEGQTVDLKKWPTRVKPLCKTKDEYRAALAEHVKKLSELQDKLYADNRFAALFVFQAMDAGGKDGCIKHVMSGVNPQGCQVYSFKHPSAQELQHDFLWRTSRDLPERGRIGIFNRSYYEEVLIVRVHPEILGGEGLSPAVGSGKSLWNGRYQSIAGFEAHLSRNDTRIVKFFLHLSKEEQRKRFLERIDDPSKNWKFSASDMAEREYWEGYANAYEKCISATSTEQAPWYIVPADNKDDARLIVSQIIVDTLEKLKLSYPITTAERRAELLKIREQLVNEAV